MTEQLSPATLRKLTLRIVLFSAMLYVVQYLDRVNVGFAALQMNGDLGLSPVDFGIAASIFAVAYVSFEIPSGLLLYRFGPRIWIARILITWGLISASLCFVQNAFQLDTVRFLLGIAEAGFYPGIIYYIAQWIPVRERGRALATMSSAGPLSVVLGAPLSGLIMTSMDGLAGIHGWRWLFFVEGMPAVVLGFFALYLMADKPKDARWLDDEEKATLTRILAAEHEENRREHRHNFLEVLKNPMVLLLAILGICFNSNAIAYWLPQIVNAMGKLSRMEVGLITAIPYLCAFLFMRRAGRYADRRGEPYTALTGVCVVTSVGLVGAAFFPPVPAIVAMAVATTGIWSYAGPYWMLATSLLTGSAAAGGTAFLNTILQIASIILPFSVGWITNITHTFTAGLLLLAAVPACGLVLIPVIRRLRARQQRRLNLPTS